MAGIDLEEIAQETRRMVHSASEVEPYELTEDDEALVVEAQLQPVTDAETFRRAGELLVIVKRTLRKIAAHYKAYKDPINELRKSILEMEHADLDSWEKAETRLSPLIADFDRQQKLAAEQERIRLQAIEDERARQTQLEQAAAVRRVAETEASPATRKALTQEAKAIERAPVVSRQVAAPAIEKVAGLSVSSGLACEIVDYMQLVKAIAEGRIPIQAIEPLKLAQDHPYLDMLATQMGAGLAQACPGLKVVEKASVRGR